LNYIYSVYSR